MNLTLQDDKNSLTLKFLKFTINFNICTGTENNYKIFLYIKFFNKDILDIKANTDTSDYKLFRYVYFLGKKVL